MDTVFVYDVDEEIAECVKARNFLPICQFLAPNYWESGIHDGIVPKSENLNAGYVRGEAEKHGCLDEFERDFGIAPLAIESRAAIQKYAHTGGKFVQVDANCIISVTRNKGNGEKEYDANVSSPLIICGEGHNSSHSAACLQVLVRTTKGTWNEVFVPRAQLVGGGNVQATLQDAGLRPGDWPTLLHILQNVEPRLKFKRIEHAGWNGDVYALPSGEVIPEDDACITTYAPVSNFDVGGDKIGADALLSAIAGNTRLLFASAVALAAPLVAHYSQAEPGGFHYYGRSSRGKTTLLCCAASIWGRGAEKKDGGIVDSWNTTGFAAEVTASQHSDCVMLFDEVRAADPKHFASLALGLANGAGKKAGRSDGTLRESVTFRPTLLSTGEISSKDYITSNLLAYHGGMSVRLVDIPADTTKGLGVFDEVPDEFEGDAGTFAKWIKRQAATHFGHHGRALVINFTSDREQFLREVCDAASELRCKLNNLGGNGDPQTGRVADRFAFVGAVSIVAAGRKLVPWAISDVQAAICAVFESWFADRGGEGSQEGLAAEKAFTAFIYANPRRFDEFHHANVTPDGVAAHVPADRNRIGAVVSAAGGERIYWIANDEALAEMVGNQRERIEPLIERIKAGQSEDWEVIGSSNRTKRDTPKGLQRAGLPKRCYCFRTKGVKLSATDVTNDNLCETVDVEQALLGQQITSEAAE